ncbi:MAG: hypothetical protein JRJ44_00170 [Deltaproteobacteria bacterium]|nr:hypothetical protein [Deltaproteobacteria bacterium]
MKNRKLAEFSYFPGCSLASAEKHTGKSIEKFCENFDINLVELEDWNCCGSSSVHSIDTELGFKLLSRNFSLCKSESLLFVPCPACYLKLKKAYYHLERDEKLQKEYREKWGKDYPKHLYIPHLFELLEIMEQLGLLNNRVKRLNGLKCVSYYGCMLAASRELRHGKSFYGIMEHIISSLGGFNLRWAHSSTCCGSYLTAMRPDIVKDKVEDIMKGAIDAGAECIVTSCVMCQLNLEARCQLDKSLPIFYLSDILSLTFEEKMSNFHLSRFFTNPKKLLKKRKIL